MVLKAFLYRMYCDLELVDNHVQHDEAHAPLSDLEKAVLVLEDRRFFQHSGVDLKSVVRECWKAVTLRRFGGASTIEMQFVRTCTGYRNLTMKRKLYEIVLSFAVSKRYSKIDVLRSYLRIVFLGSGITGVSGAARVLYGKAVHELALDEACEIAAMMVYPRARIPTSLWALNVKRRAKYAKQLISHVPLRCDGEI